MASSRGTSNGWLKSRSLAAASGRGGEEAIANHAFFFFLSNELFLPPRSLKGQRSHASTLAAGGAGRHVLVCEREREREER